MKLGRKKKVRISPPTEFDRAMQRTRRDLGVQNIFVDSLLPDRVVFHVEFMTGARVSCTWTGEHAEAFFNDPYMALLNHFRVYRDLVVQRIPQWQGTETWPGWAAMGTACRINHEIKEVKETYVCKYCGSAVPITNIFCQGCGSSRNQEGN